MQLASFSLFGERTFSFHSVLFMERMAARGGGELHSSPGPQATGRYLDEESEGRLIQSLKSCLPSRTSNGTATFGREHSLEQLFNE